MYHYLFTNDLRISNLQEMLKKTATCFVTNTVPSSTVNKSENNNMMTLGFYFNFTQDSMCAKNAASGHIKDVVLNFIKKFQFPNPRTQESMDYSVSDGITVAPMRSILQVLYIMQWMNSDEAFLTREEILNFIFYNENVAKTTTPNIIEVVNQIINYRKTGKFPSSVELSPEKRLWKHEERQIREMTKILTWSGCVSESVDGKIYIQQEILSTEQKAMLFDIITYSKFWTPRDKTFSNNKYSYQAYMDMDAIEPEKVELPINISANMEGKNVLLYGVPGAGKSHKIKTEYCDDEAFMERVVFHPDYTYSDFIGQILPKTEDGKISYPFIPGPFTRILKKANDDPDNMYYLVVEEINRGNAPAIFGEVFQLLDRKNGESEYGINNADIAKEAYGDTGHPVKIPNNLTILATMNTADQNVFTLDTAFKRRWKMESIPNDVAGCGHANKHICGRSVTWFTFADTINNRIIDFGEGNLSSEDNRLGAYFVNEEELSDVSSFAEKVLMYLWNDAFKFDKEKIFKPEYKTLEQLILGFKKSYFDVFCDDLNFDNTPSEPETEDGENAPDIQEYLYGKNEQMVMLFNYLADEVEAVIPTLLLQPVNTLQYAKFTCDGISRKSFADIMIKKDSIEAYCEKPLSDELISVVEEQSRDKFHSHNYLYRIKTEEDIETAVQIITESYEQLKTGA